MNKIIGVILIAVGIFAGMYAYDLYQEATANITVLGLDISAQDKEVTSQAYVFGGLGVIGILAGLFMWAKK